MIDIAVIAGVPHLQALSARGTIDMALTHLVLTQPTYAAYHRDRSQAGIRVLLDNSAYELEADTGQGLSAGPVLQAANLIAASVVICQDVLYDGPATVAATRRFIAQAAGGPYQLMAVPQGRTRNEWLVCLDQLVQLPQIDLIGLSKLSVPRSFNAPVAEARLECLTTLVEHGLDKPVHLLGGDRSLPWELAEHRRRGHDRHISGNDSSYAFWYAATGIPIDATTGRAATDAPDKPDLEHRTLDPAALHQAQHAIDILRTFAGLNQPSHSDAAKVA